MTLDKHTLLHVYFCCSPHQTWVQFCNTSRQGRCRQGGRCVTSDTKVQQQHWGAHYSVANMSTTSRHICTLLAIETRTQSHSQVWMCDPFAVRVWSRPSNALFRSVPPGYWGKNGWLSAVQTLLFAGHLSKWLVISQGPRVGYAQLASYWEIGRLWEWCMSRPVLAGYWANGQLSARVWG